MTAPLEFGLDTFGDVTKDASGNVRMVGGLVLSGLAQAPTDISLFEAPKGNPSGNGPAILSLILAADGVTAVLPPDAALSTTALAALFAGELYFNVSTLAHPSGEIRGAIELQGGVGASAPSIDESQVLPVRTNSTADLSQAHSHSNATRRSLQEKYGYWDISVRIRFRMSYRLSVEGTLTTSQKFP